MIEWPTTSGGGSGAPTARPVVSVCMPVGRGGEWFRTALASALSQTVTSIEVLVGDNSGGAARAVVDALADPRVRYISRPRRLSYTLSHSSIIDEAVGDYVAFLHDDDEWEPDYLSAAADVFAEHPSVGFVVSGARDVDARGVDLGVRPTTMAPGLQRDHLSTLMERREMLALPSATVFRRQALADNRRPWMESASSDLTMYVDLVVAGWQVHHLDVPRLRYRIHDQQIGTDEFVHRDGLVKVWETYRFDDPRLEVLRAKRVATALVARAGILVRNGRGRDARQDLRRALRECRSAVDLRWPVIWVFSLLPVRAALWSRGLVVRARGPERSRHMGA